MLDKRERGAPNHAHGANSECGGASSGFGPVGAGPGARASLNDPREGSSLRRPKKIDLLKTSRGQVGAGFETPTPSSVGDPQGFTGT